MSETKFFGVPLATSFIPFYDEYVNQLNRNKQFSKPVDIELSSLSIEELNECGKDDEAVKDDFLIRILSLIDGLSTFYQRKYKIISKKDLFEHLLFTSLTTFTRYQSGRGHFENYFFRTMKLASGYFWATFCRELDQHVYKYHLVYTKFDDNLAGYLDTYLLSRDETRYLQMKVDLDNFTAPLPEKEKHILQMYLCSYTFREIAAKASLPLSTVAGIVKTRLSDFKRAIGM